MVQENVSQMNDRLEMLFHEALSLPSGERTAFLLQSCGSDNKLYREVQALIDDANRGEAMFGVAITRLTSTITPMEGTRVGPFRLVRRIGEGGMGVVYLARREEGDFDQQAAIKFVQGGPELLDRFRHERRILASLAHPNIAGVLDGGTTADGLPYLVMEYIEGQTLLEYCRERALPIRERLRLFEQICSAVQHAHQKLVVHRDIKPGNILVTPAGVPKLLDFGIAKLLLPDESAPRTLTGVGMRLLTPDYASPEQFRGEDVSVATDVYSLGAVLYELLTGKRPHELRSYVEPEVALAICENEVRPPSEVVEDNRARRELSGDLDNIVGLALRKDPARRYVSAEQFAGDIRRYLDGRPVLARPETYLYRACKFVARNGVSVGATVLVLASLAAGIVATSLQARRADAQAARAERRFNQVRKLANTFVFDVYDGMAEIPGTAALRARVVTTALEYLDSLASEAGDETAFQLELAAAYKRIADVQGNPSRSGLGHQTAAALASYEKARAILNRLAEKPYADPKVLTDLAILERAIGFMKVSTGNPAGGIEHQRLSVAAWERRNPQRGQDLEADTGIAQAWGMMGQALAAQGESEAAVDRHTAAVDLLRGWLPRQTGQHTHGTISNLLFDLGQARREVGDLTGAIRTYREAEQIRRKLLQQYPHSLPYRRRIFILNYSLASASGDPLKFNLGDRAAAEIYAAAALREVETIAKEDQGSARSVRDRMFGNLMMGRVLLADARRALPYLETALDLAYAQTKENPEEQLNRQSEAEAEEALARALLKTGNRRRALDLLYHAAGTLDGLTEEAPQMIEYRFEAMRTWTTLGDALPMPAAAEFYRKAYAVAESAPQNDRNVWELIGRAEANLRWPRWNPSAAAEEQRRKLEIALRSWQKLAARAPGNTYVQAALAEARRSLALVERP
jgi:predicted Ser/Thr protein kinase